MNRARIAKLALALGVILLALWGIRVILLTQSLRARLAKIESIASGSGSPDIAATCSLVTASRDDLSALSGQTGVFIAIAPVFGWLPVWGGDLRAAPDLISAASDLMNAGALVCNSFADPNLALTDIVRALESNQADFAKARAYVARAEQTLARVDAASLSLSNERRVGLLQRALPLARVGLQAVPLAPTLAGFDQPRTYLVFALNEDELRPGGGFITGVGEVRVEGGRIATMTFRDSYAADDFSKPYPYPPEPLRRLMGIDYWVLRDSNWSPDFPTAARQAIELYRPGYPVTIDGVIALDQQAVQEFVAAVGPLRIEESSEPITGQNIIAFIRRAWAPPDGNFTGEWWLRRKSFMVPLANAARARLEARDFDKATFAKTVWHLLEGKHLQIYMQNPDAAALLREIGWDGALRNPTGDFVMVVDANVGYNKVNARVQQSLAYQVDLRAAPRLAELTLVYTHTATTANPCRPEARYDPTYEQMMSRCYWDYLRVFLPSTTQMNDATRLEISGALLWSGQSESGAVIARQADEGAFLTLEMPALIPPAKTQTRQIFLTLAEDVIKWSGAEGRYTLTIQKQAGSSAYPVVVQVRLPEASVLMDAQPQPVTVENDQVLYRLNLERDLEFRVRFKRR